MAKSQSGLVWSSQTVAFFWIVRYQVATVSPDGLVVLPVAFRGRAATLMSEFPRGVSLTLYTLRTIDQIDKTTI